MDLRALQYFVKVYENGSLSAAAKQCFVAQPSISTAILQLEQELNSQLFIRHARGVSASEHGHKLYPLAKQMLGQADAIKQSFIAQQHVVPVRLGLTKGLGVARMSKLLKEFTSSFENIELSLVEPDEPCDAKIIAEQEVKTDESFNFMWQENYVLTIPYNHPLALQDKVTLFDLDHQPFIQRTTCSKWPALIETLGQHEILLDVRAKIQTIDYAIGLVKAGVGLALLPHYPELAQHNDIVLKPIEQVNFTRTIGLAYQKQTPITEQLSKIIQVNFS